MSRALPRRRLVVVQLLLHAAQARARVGAMLSTLPRYRMVKRSEGGESGTEDGAQQQAMVRLLFLACPEVAAAHTYGQVPFFHLAVPFGVEVEF